jgi:uncharacterized membrane protein
LISSGYSLLTFIYPDESGKSLFRKPLLWLNLSLLLSISTGLIWKFLLIKARFDIYLLILSLVTIVFLLLSYMSRSSIEISELIPQEKPLEVKKPTEVQPDKIIEPESQPPKQELGAKSETKISTDFKTLSFDFVISHDLSIITILSILLIVLIFIPFVALSLVYTVLGIIFIFLIPGYEFIRVIFPKKSTIGNTELLGLTIGLSLCITSIIGILLNYTPMGLKLVNIFLGLAVFSLILLPMVHIRRKRLT